MFQRSESDGVAPAEKPMALAPNEVPVSEVTTEQTPTTPVRLVSGVVDVPTTPGAVRDGTITGPPVYGAEHCPLLVTDPSTVNDTTVVEEHTGADGEYAGRTVHRYPEHVIGDPVECPTCGIMRERHGLLLNVETGERDCAIAIQQSKKKAYQAQFGADIASRADAMNDAQNPETGPAASGNRDFAGLVKPRDTRELQSENMADEAKAAVDARSAQPAPQAPLTQDADGKTLTGDAPMSAEPEQTYPEDTGAAPV